MYHVSVLQGMEVAFTSYIKAGRDGHTLEQESLLGKFTIYSYIFAAILYRTICNKKGITSGNILW